MSESPSKSPGNSSPIGELDLVSSPPHYTAGRQEVIDTIEDAIRQAPEPVVAFLHGQTLKYHRLWLKGNPKQDAEKARWYLLRLLERL